MLNNVGNAAIFQLFAFIGALLYIPFFNVGLFTRPIAFPHFMVPAGSFHVLQITFDEFRKVLIRRGMVRIKEKQKMVGWFA
jgi:hypothetical protein